MVDPHDHVVKTAFPDNRCTRYTENLENPSNSNVRQSRETPQTKHGTGLTHHLFAFTGVGEPETDPGLMEQHNAGKLGYHKSVIGQNKRKTRTDAKVLNSRQEPNNLPPPFIQSTSPKIQLRATTPKITLPNHGPQLGHPALSHNIPPPTAYPGRTLSL